MCLAKVLVAQAGGDSQEIGDVVGVEDDGATLTVTTLFGEEHAFPDMKIERVDLPAGMIFVVEGRR